MAGTEKTYQCRACRQYLPQSEVDWRSEGGKRRAYHKPGLCPSSKKRDEAELGLQLQNRKLRREAMDAKASAGRALAKLEQVQDALAVALEIRDTFGQGCIQPPSEPDMEESAPILMLSDLHCGQIIKRSAVNGINEFSPDIFDDSLDAVFRNSLKIINGQRHTMTIREAVVWLGGDMIEGELHNDAVQSQTLTTTQQIIRCERALIRGLDFLLKHSDLEKILLPCNVGNHGRNTKKQQSNSTENSYEWMMYQALRKHYREEDRLEWIIAEADCIYLNVYDKTLRFFHGDSVKYNGGAAGPQWNVDKHVKNLDQTIPADHTFHGHFHTFYSGSRASGNGSLPGAAPYGMQSGYRIERPQQGMRFMHSRLGFVGSFPVFTE